MKRFQNHITTGWFREADAILLARQFMGPPEGHRILSFGCSIGDELATLRVVFPSSEIYGCEIDPFALEKAKLSVGHLADVFLSSEREIRSRGSFDMICAFSSLCRNPPPSLSVMRQDFPFSLFDDTVSLLSENLNVGGMLCLKNTSYPFSKTTAAKLYNPIRSDSILQSGYIPVLNPEGTFALSAPNSPCGPIHKIEDVSGLEDWDFIDSVFQKKVNAKDNGEVKWHRSTWSRPDLQFEELASWTRSNLDCMDCDVDKLIELRHTYRSFRSAQRTDAVFVERDIARKSISNGQMLQMSSAGWWS